MPNLEPIEPPQILVVDDERTLRLVLKHAMQKEAYRVIEASDGAECLELCQQQLPDLILMDAIMPVINGFDCCAELHRQFGDRCPPVLMITALDDQDSVDRAFESGASDYVTKPIHWAVLRQRVRRLLQTRWAITELHRKMERERSLTAQLEAVNHTLKRLADVDGLTQIANRRCFNEYLQREWQRLLNEQAPLSLILCDIDGFKLYNDRFGHQAGDECLKQVASLLDGAVARAHCIVSDRALLYAQRGLAARYGGEEFVLVLPNTTLEAAVEVAKTAQAALQATAIPATHSAQFMTLSFGVASVIPAAIVIPDDLITAADKALYRAKQKGRDRIIVGSVV